MRFLRKKRYIILEELEDMLIERRNILKKENPYSGVSQFWDGRISEIEYILDYLLKKFEKPMDAVGIGGR